MLVARVFSTEFDERFRKLGIEIEVREQIRFLFRHAVERGAREEPGQNLRANDPSPPDAWYERAAISPMSLLGRTTAVSTLR